MFFSFVLCTSREREEFVIQANEETKMNSGYYLSKNQGKDSTPIISQSAITMESSLEPLYLGDANKDGYVTAMDARYVLQIAAGIKTLSREEIRFFDMNFDGVVTAIDARMVLQTVAGLRDLENVQPAPTILEQGKCGDNLYWQLNSNGELRIYGEGPMYDYVKYFEPSPWYKYRNEPYISEDGKNVLDLNGDVYCSTEVYKAQNPNNWKIRNIVIEPGVTYLGDWAFYRNCVKEITVPETVTETGYFCFRYSPTLTILNLPESLIVLDDFAISRNYALKEINFGSKLEKIGVGGLSRNIGLESIELPDSLTSINEQLSPQYTMVEMNYETTGLLMGCTSLKNVYLGNVDGIPNRTFLNTAIESIQIPNTVKSIEQFAFYNCSSLKEVTFEENSNCKFIGMYSFSGCTSLENIVIPNSVERLGESAFQNCSYLKSVIFEEGSKCTLIDKLAFNNCSSLTSVSGGMAVERISESAFSSCTAIQEYEFSDSNVVFSENLFYGAKKLKSAYIGKRCSVIPKQMFAHSGIRTLTISKNVKEIGDAAVFSCKSLTDIYYEGTLNEWKEIKKATNWANGNSEAVITVHFSDGTTAILKDVK